MKTPSWKLVGQWLLVISLTSHLLAQTTIYPGPGLIITTDSNNTLIEAASFNSSATFTFAGVGNPQAVWMPSLAAFRAGGFLSSQTIGEYSAAFGTSQAGGAYSFAAGSSSAAGSNSTALGNSTVSSTGQYSQSGGLNVSVSGPYSFAFGLNSSVSGSNSVAMGFYAAVAGNNSFALGNGAIASGNDAFSIGNDSVASGYGATAMGFSTQAMAASDFVVGTGNTGAGEPPAPGQSGGTPNSTTWVLTDPIFEVGNATVTIENTLPVVGTHSDALVVYKNGDTVISGPGLSGTGATLTAPAVVLTQPSGDIPMYQGGD